MVMKGQLSKGLLNIIFFEAFDREECRYVTWVS